MNSNNSIIHRDILRLRGYFQKSEYFYSEFEMENLGRNIPPKKSATYIVAFDMKLDANILYLIRWMKPILLICNCLLYF